MVIYRWFHNDNPGTTINPGFMVDDAGKTYTVKPSDNEELIGVEVSYVDNSGDPSAIKGIMYLTVGTRLIRPEEGEEDNDNTLTPASPDESSQVESGNGSDTITDSTGNDIIEGGLGDDTIDLGSGDSDSDTVIYGIGDQTAQDGGDDITNFEWGKDRFIFSLESSTETDALTDLASFVNYITAGTPDDLSDDQFRVTFAFDFLGDPMAPTAEVKGIYLHFSDSVFYGGGRISMPILEIEFSENLPDDTIIDDVFGGDVSAGIDSASGLVKLEYLNALLGGDDDFEAIGFQVVAPDAV